MSILAIEYYYRSSIPDAFFQLTILVLGASIAAYLTTYTYDYISKSTQEREWKRSIKMRKWESIYLPIYKEAVEVLKAVEHFSYYFSEMWRDFSKSPTETILEAIDSGCLELIRLHIDDYGRYDKAVITYNQALKTEIFAQHQRIFPDENPGRWNLFVELLTWDRNPLYFLGVKTDLPSHTETDYMGLYVSLRREYPDAPSDPRTVIEELRSKAAELPGARGLISAQKKLVRSTEKLVRYTKKAIQEPYAT